MKHTWRQWLGNILGGRRAGSVSCRVRARPRFHPSLEILEDRTLPSGGVPFVQSINRGVPTGPTTNATSVSYAVTFNEAVTGVVASDFLVTTDGSVQAATPVVVSGNGAAYTVAVNGIHGSGDLGLDLIDDGSIQAGGIPLGSPGGSNGSFQGQTYNILQTYPWVVSINRANPPGPATNATTVSYTVTFSEPVTGVDPTDFQLVTTDTVASTLTQVTPVSGSVFTVTVSGITGSGTLGLNLVDNGSIHDLAGNPLTQPAAAAAFQQTPTFPVGVYPTSAAFGDLNGDGKPDLAVTNELNNTVSVLLANGDGTFQAQQAFQTGGGPISVAIADVNGDGKLDLVVANEGSDTVSVLLGNGNGTFQTQLTLLAGLVPTSLAVGDLNGNRTPDLAVTNLNDNTVSVFLGNGNGTFQTPEVLATGSGPISVAIGDVNGDGKLDLAVANRNSNTVSVFLGNGNGTFQSQMTFATGVFPSSVALSDVNGDGKPSLAVANLNSNTISVLLGNGDGTFQTQMTFASGPTPSSIVVGDVNGDGRPDFAVANSHSDTVSVLLGNGNGTFQAPPAFATARHPVSVALSDVNGDGRPDLAVVNKYSNTVGVLLGTGDGTFKAPRRFATGSQPISVALGDVNGDGKPDLAVANQGSNTVSVFLANGNGNFQTPTAFPTGSFPVAVALADVNGDGKLDLVAANDTYPDTYPGSVSVLLGNGNGTFQTQATFGTGRYPQSVAVADVNGDGKPDLIAANYDYSGPGTVSVLLGNGNGTFQSRTTFGVGNGSNSVVVGDVNHDGKADLIVANSGSNSLSVLLGNGDGTFQARLSLATGSWPVSVAVADFEGESHPDIVVANNRSGTPTSGGTVSVFLGNGNGTFHPQITFATGFGPRSVAVADVNGDGKSDLVVANDSDYSVSVLLGNGDGTFQNQTVLAAGGGAPSVAVADVSGDGRPDLVIANGGADTVTVLLANGNGNFTGQVYVISNPGPATHFVVSGFPSNIAAGVPFTFTVTAEDQFNNTATAYVGGLHFLSSDPNAVLPAFATLTGGVGTFSATLKTAGNQTLIATDTVTTSITGTSNAITVSALSVTHLALTGVPTTITAGAPFGFTVTAQDQYGNTATSYNGTIGFSSSDSQAVLPADAGLTNGVGVFSANLKTAGSQRITATNLVMSSAFAQAPGSPIGVGTRPLDVAVGDFNGDGTPDLAVTNEGGVNVSILLGNGNGTFQTGLAFFVGPYPAGLALGDFNHDGKLDLVVTNEFTSNVSVLLGNGDGTFGPATDYAVGTNPEQVAVGDFSGDGNLDLAVVNSGSNNVSVLLGNGNGTFGPAKNYAAGSDSYGITAADFNHDDKLDVVLANNNTNTVSVLLGNGDGTFGPSTNYVVGGLDPVQVAVGDFNGDGNLDLAVASLNQQNISVLLGNGNGTFKAGPRYNVSGFGASGVAVADVNGDGKLDLVVDSITLNGGIMTVLLGNGNGTFGNVQSFAVGGSYPRGLAVGDFNGDGLPDVAIAQANSNTVTILLNQNIAASATTLVRPVAASHFTVQAPRSVPPGTAFTFTVTAQDQYGNTASAYTGTVDFTSSDTAAALPANSILTSGTGNFSATLQTLGRQTLTATDTVTSSITGTSGMIVSNPASHFLLSTPTLVARGDVFDFTVTALDQFNNTAQSYSGMVHFSSADPFASLPANVTLTYGVGAFTAALVTAGNQTLTATDTVTSSITGTSNMITVTVPATQFVLGGTPTNIAAGTPFAFTVTAEDQFNNTVGFGGSVHFTSSDSQAALPADAALANGSGTFSVTLKTAGSQGLTVADTLTGTITGSAVVSVTPLAANHLAVFAPRLAAAGSAISFTVAAEDPFNNTTPSYSGSIHFTSTDSAATLPADGTLTNGVGSFSVTLATSGNQTLTAADTITTSLSGSSNTIAVSGPATALAFGVPVGSAAGTGFRITITAVDTSNNTASFYIGTVHFTSSDSQAVLPANATLTNGVGIFSVTLGTVGSQILTATDTVTSSTTSFSTAIIVGPGQAARFSVAAPGSATAASAFTITVTALDQFNNTASGYAGKVQFTTSDTNNLVKLPGSYTFNAADFGQHTFTSGVNLFSAGPQTVTVTDASQSTLTGTSNTITVSPLSANHLTLTAPATVTAGGPFSVTVTALDPYNNTATGYTGTVTLNASGDTAATFAPASATLTSGVGIFTATLFSPTSSRTLTATGSGVGTSTTSVNVTVSAVQLTVTAPPIVVEGSTFGVTVTATDLFGNTDTQYNKAVTLHDSVSNANFVGFVAGGTGVINVRLVKPGTETLTASDGTLNGTSNTITITQATHFVLGAASPQTAGGAFSFTVMAEDNYGNTDTLYSGTVAFASTDTAGNFIPASGVLPGGTAVFTATLFRAGSQTLTAGDGTISGTSGTITVTARPATHFAVSAPVTTTAGASFGFTVTALDPYNNIAPGYSGTVTFASTDTAASLPANGTLTSSVGIFRATLTTAGSQTLTATDTLTSSITGTTSAIAVSPAAAAHFVVLAPGSATAGGAFLFIVTAQDPYNNTASGYRGTVAFGSSDSAAALPQASMLAGGVGTFSATLKTAGTQTITATDAPNSVTGTSNTIAVNAAAATHFVVSAQSTTVAGNNMLFTVVAEDQFNNTATGYTGTAAFTSTDTGAFTKLPLPHPLVAGLGTFSATLTTAGNQTLTATDGTITGTSNSITVSATVGSHFVVSAPATATAGNGFQFTVTAEDRYNNPTTAYFGTIAFTSSDTGASTKLPSSNPLSAGVGIFSATLTTAGSQTLTATDTNTSSITGFSNTITVSATTASHFAVTAPGTATAGVATTFTVTAEDRYNNTATGYTGTVAFASTDNAATLPANGALTGGLGAFSVTLATLGSQTITATDTLTGAITGTSNAITVNLPPATHFYLAPGDSPGANYNVTAGNAFGFMVTALDQFNHTAVGYSGIVTFSSSDLAATLPADSILTSGVGAFSATLVTAGSQTLSAADTVTSSIIGSAAISVAAAAAAQFAITAPAFAMTDRAFGFTVLAQDQYGNTATGYTGTVGFSSSDSDPGALMPAASTLSSGMGTFSATLVTIGTQTLSAQDTQTPTINGSTTVTVPVTVYIPSLTTTPSATTTVPIEVNALEDPAGSFGQSGLSGGAFVLYYDSSVFGVSPTLGSNNTDVQLGTLGTDTAPGDGYSPAADNGWQVDVTTSDPGVLAITLSNPSGAIPLTGTGGGTLVTVNFHVLPSAPLGSSVINLAATDTAGDSTYINDALDDYGAQASYNLIPAPQNNTVLSPSYVYSGTDPVDGIVTVTATTGTNATHFLVTATSTTIAGVPFLFTVTAETAANTTATGYSGTATFSTTDTGNRTLVWFPSPLVSGVGVFSATLTTAGTQTLTATDGSIAGTSGPITVTHNQIYQFVVSAPATAFGSVGFQFIVTAEDIFNNLDPGYPGLVKFASSDTGAILPPHQHLISGVGTFSATLTTLGSQTLTASDTMIHKTGTSGPIVVSGQTFSATLTTAGNLALTATDNNTSRTTGTIGTPSGRLAAANPPSLVPQASLAARQDAVVLEPAVTVAALEQTSGPVLLGSVSALLDSAVWGPDEGADDLAGLEAYFATDAGQRGHDSHFANRPAGKG